MAAVDIVRNQNCTSFVLANAPHIRGRVLDVGCGTQPYKPLFPDCQWLGLDNRPVGDLQADMCSIPLEDGFFDTVLCIDALNFTPHPADALAEMVRLLRPGGHLIVVARTTCHDDSVYFGIHSAGINAILKELGMSDTGEEESNVSMKGLFSRGEADNFFTNQTWLEGTGNLDFDRYNQYIDSRYPAVCGVCATKE